MSAELIAVAAAAAGVSMVLMGVLCTWAVAHVYQGGHVQRLEVIKDRRRAVAYHRLSPDERRIWRQTAQTPVTGTPRDPSGRWVTC